MIFFLEILFFVKDFEVSLFGASFNFSTGVFHSIRIMHYFLSKSGNKMIFLPLFLFLKIQFGTDEIPDFVVFGK